MLLHHRLTRLICYFKTSSSLLLMMEGAIGPYWYAQKTCLNLGSVCIAIILQVVDMRKKQVEYYDSLKVDNPTYWDTARLEHIGVNK